MKKKLVMSLTDIGLIEVADVLIGFWIVGLLLRFKPVETVEFFMDWTWGFFALAIIVGALPAWKAFYGEKGVAGNISDTVVKKKVRGKKK